MEGDLEKAAGLLARALRARPGDPDALAHLSVVAGRRGLSAEADAARKRLFAYFPPTDATFTLGVALEESGDHAGAARCFLQVASWLPELRRAHLLAAASLGAVGETSRAVAEAEKAFALREDPAPMRGPILAPYEALVRADPGSAVASFLLARTLRRYGEFDRAEAVAESALEKDPSFEPARRELALLGVARAKP
jgi:tetratricopeptide (TPR) repeat protein